MPSSGHRYCDFPVLNNANIQTHFQLEKHIVFQNIYQDIVANNANIQTHFQLEKHIVFQNIYQDIVAKI